MRPHPLKWPAIRTIRRTRAASIAVINPIRLHWVSGLTLSAAFTLGWLAFGLPFQHFETKRYEVTHQIRERIADLRARSVVAREAMR